MGNGVSHAASDEEGEAGNLDSLGDLTEVTTNTVLERLMKICVSHEFSIFPTGIWAAQ